MIFPVTRALPLVAALLLPVSASAHAILIDSSPASRASVPAGHVGFMLHYNSRIDRGRSRLTLVAPDKSQTRLPVGADGAGDVMTTETDLTPGE